MANKTTLSLGNVLDIAHVGKLKPRLAKALKKKLHVVLIADKVERADIAGVQLVYSFMRYAKKKGIAVTWQNPSDKLLETVSTLGMSEALDFV